MAVEILCTLGPSSMNPFTLKRLEALGVNLYRINLSHTSLEVLPKMIETIRANSNVPICLDSEGAQIRTGTFKEGAVMAKEGSIVEICNESVEGTAQRFTLTPFGIIDQFEVGDFISIDFNSVFAQVIEQTNDFIKIKILNTGKIGTNKAVTLERHIDLDPITPKDQKAFELGVKMGIKDFALSFAHNENDVKEVRKLVGKDARIISKIECHDALLNLEDIAKASDAILIDRGDLSREEPLERIPFLQKRIIQMGKKTGTKVYVATNLLESMIVEQLPTRAEVNDIYNTLVDGADGLVLAAETAIGKHPTKAVVMVKKVIHEFERAKIDTSLPERSMNTFSLLVPPHGGVLYESTISQDNLKNLKKFDSVETPEVFLMDAEQIAIGTYSPIQGFMSEAELNSVLDNYKLVDGNIWTLPIVLQFPEEKAKKLAKGKSVVLKDDADNPIALLHIDDIYKPDIDSICKKWFGTNSDDHPGVKRVKTSGEYFIGGKVDLIHRMKNKYQEFIFTPKQSRYLFERKGWSRVVGFHSRNVVHRVHEYIQKEALKRTHADGLYISPVIGPKKPGDFKTNAILNSYKLMIEKEYYPEGKVVLGAFHTYSRYSGPREAVFTALCRKNMGCSHFILGRDHTGVGDFYSPDANAELFKELGDLGIEPVFFEPIGYNEETQEYGPETNAKKTQSISGTQVRQSLTNQEKVPDWFMRDVIQEMLIEDIKSGTSIFFTEEK